MICPLKISQIVTYNHCGLSLITKKLNHHHLSIDVFQKIIRKREIVIEKMVMAARRKNKNKKKTKNKNTASGGRKLFELKKM